MQISPIATAGHQWKELGKLVLESLELRPFVNRVESTHLSPSMPRKCCSLPKVHQSWFVNFFANHPDISERQPCPEEMRKPSG